MGLVSWASSHLTPVESSNRHLSWNLYRETFTVKPLPWNLYRETVIVKPLSWNRYHEYHCREYHLSWNQCCIYHCCENQKNNLYIWGLHCSSSAQSILNCSFGVSLRSATLLWVEGMWLCCKSTACDPCASRSSVTLVCRRNVTLVQVEEWWLWRSQIVVTLVRAERAWL
jgi:hypothetical protein